MKDIKQSISSITGDVGEKMFVHFHRLLEISYDCDEIILFFSSYGGNADYIDPIVFLIKAIERQAKLIIVNICDVSSAAADIFIQAENRAMLKDSCFMIHNTRCQVEDATAQKLVKEAKLLKELDKKFYNQMLKKIKLTKGELAKINRGEDLILKTEAKCKRAKIINITEAQLNEII